MTVRELIEKLSKADQDKVMYLDDNLTGELFEIEGVFESTSLPIVGVTPFLLRDDHPAHLMKDEHLQAKVL